MTSNAETSDLCESFDIDDDDVKILKIVQETPEISHVEIARIIKKSQPAVGARVLKLQRKDLLATQKGINFKTVKEKIFLMMVNLQTKDPNWILTTDLPSCPFVINIFKTTGQKNLTVLFVSTNMQKLECIIDRHFRSNPDVISVDTSFVVDLMKDFVIPINWDFLKFEDIPCGDICCQKAKQGKANGTKSPISD
ncbi:MAG TPA: Lrp/AsnC family transcriptional regulator [Candidatus Lokiarchaeia archaeon]|nr:Lrp/AsnC family transcriptional regulator [Candidatus Lokiarchaeia archaeon]